MKQSPGTDIHWTYTLSSNAMQMQNETWLEFFAEATQRAGLSLSEKQLELFLRFMLELLDWNRSINLTRIVEPHAIAIKHFLDSILVARYIETDHKSIADIGSGGGFPGIPLAILDPSCRLVLIESVRKKCAFLKHAIRTLHISNVQVFNGRAQTYPTPAVFDLAISRAFSSLSDFTAIATPLIKPQGNIICMKGHLPQDELDELKTRFEVEYTLDSYRYCLTNQGEARSIVVLQPCFT